MPGSVRDQIVTAAVNALNASGAPATAYRTRTEALGVETVTAYVVHLDQEQITERLQDRVVRQTVMNVIAVAKGAAPVDQVDDALLVWATKQILTDATLNGIAQMEETGTKWEFGGTDSDMAFAQRQFTAAYTTDTFDETVLM